ncbi:MAG: putative toxin-antitoxin system toxin component, PIN family, partial [Chloroflexota bacterium]|nr:putative toxin-antitoxin system toxin component, PIN family [Chloroflexota bacterium]
MTVLKAVLDTNIFVSALIVPVGKPAQIVSHAREQQFTLLLSKEIIHETRDALHRRHIQKRFHPTDENIE